MRGTYWKILILIVLAVTTFYTTSTIAARLKTKKREAAAQEAVDSTGQFPKHQASGGVKIEALSVERVADGFRVRGKAHVKNHSKPDRMFIWGVRVYEPATKSTIAQVWYDTQTFQVQRDTHELHPTFDDVIGTLTPGQYDVSLTLYRVPNEGVAALGIDAVRNSHIQAKKTVAVKVP